jgi:hypothetical protein
MKKLLILFVFLFGSTIYGQKTFDVKNVSEYFDVKINVAKCEDSSCTGKASYSFYKKGSATPYQTINLPDTYIDTEGGTPSVNETLLYDKQSAINVGDFNFDGMEDVAICDGTNGGYGMPSYRIYLSNRAAKKFVYDAAFSKLGAQLGMFETDKTKKVLRVFSKSGCCWHQTQEFAVVNNQPKKVFEETEDATIADETKVLVTTKKLVDGKWQTTSKKVKREE